MANIDLKDITGGDGSQGFVLFGVEAFDRAYSVASAGDFNGDGFDDLIIGAYTADGPSNSRNGAGESYVVFGKATGFPATIDLATITAGDGSQGFVLYGESAGDQAGRSVASAGDVNGDGFADLVVGARLADGPSDGRNSAGDSYVIFGKGSGFSATLDLASITSGDGSQGFVLQGETAADFFGGSVASAGDVNGDGFSDLLVGALLADGPADGRDSAGDSYVVFGKASGFGATIDLASITAGDGSQGFVIHGETAIDTSGVSVASAGDVNGDGFDDLIIGAQLADGPLDGRDEAGDSYVIFGKAGGFSPALDLAAITAGDGSQGFVLQGETSYDYSGFSVASAGDVNGDGFADLVVGARFADGPSDGRSNAGDSYVIFGKAGGFGAEIDLATITAGDGSQGFVLHGEAAADFSGRSVASAGDVNGDGFDDLIIGADGADGPANGRESAGDSYVIFGKASGFGATLDLATITAGDGSQGFVIHGEDATEFSGRSVSSAGDINGDGFDDLMIGASRGRGPSNSRPYAGDSYIIYGSATIGGSSSKLTEAAGGTGTDFLGGSTGGKDVLNGGGGDDDLLCDGDGDVLRGGEGDDVFTLFDADFSRIAGGTGFDVLFLDAAMTLTDADFRSASDLELIELCDEAVNLTLGAIAAHAFNGLAGDDFRIIIDGLMSLNAAHVIDAGGLNRAISADFTNNAAKVVLRGGSSDEIIAGGAGNDQFTGNAGDDLLAGEGGNDRLTGGAGGDDLQGGSGIDTAVYAASGAGVSVDLGADTAAGGDAAGDTLDLIENLAGSAFDDKLVGNNLANVFNGNQGGDDVAGGAGNDTLNGGTGDDTLIGGNGSDVLAGEAGADTMNGGADYDTATYRTATAGVTLDLVTKANNTGDAAGDMLIAFERFLLTNFSDSFTGDGLANHVFGYAGGDTVVAGGGRDSVSGGDDDDGLGGDAGDDVLRGEDGNDTLSGGADNDTLIGGAGGDSLDGGDGLDTAYFDTAPMPIAIDLVTPANNAGEAAGDSFAAIERFFLSNGGDSFSGSSANGSVSGLAGNDTLAGGGGIDILVGGLGVDRFVFGDGWGRDVINDFADGSELLDLSAVAGVDDIGDLIIRQGGANTLVIFTGNSITLANFTATNLTAADFTAF